jgi:hypothetical protein
MQRALAPTSRPTSARLLLALASCLTAVGACSLLVRPVPIADLVAHPERYEGQDIRIRGRVTGGTQIPFVEIRFFVLTDGKESLPVVSYDSLPMTDHDVTVSGTFSTVAIIGGQSVGPHLTVGKPARH